MAVIAGQKKKIVMDDLSDGLVIVGWKVLEIDDGTVPCWTLYCILLLFIIYKAWKI